MSYNLRYIGLIIISTVIFSYSFSQSTTDNSIYTSEFHKENAGKIIFSKTPVELGKENQSEISDKFSSTDNIWGIIYLNNSFKNLTNSNVHEVIQYIIVDGKETAKYSFRMVAEKIEQTYLKTEIIVPPEKAKTKGVKTYVRGLSAITPGMHTVRVIMQIHDDTVASGEFAYDCTGGVDNIKLINQEFETKTMNSITLPNPVIRDILLETEILNSVSDMPGKPLKAIITDNGWTLIKNLEGDSAFRTINAALAFKKPDGNCSMIFISFRQDFDGKDYGKTRKYSVGNSYDIPCDNIK